jgi:hypothetical protein
MKTDKARAEVKGKFFMLFLGQGLAVGITKRKGISSF